MSTYQKVLVVIFIAATAWSAIDPRSGSNWFLEMLPILVAPPLLVYFSKRFKISNLSYTLMTIYMLLLVVQAHYGVGFVPIGDKVAPLFGSNRNIFDRNTHFCSGLLLFYPLYEILRQDNPKRDFQHYIFSAALIMGLGAVYEVGEFLTFRVADRQLAYLFIGTHDPNDSYKDLTLALIGTIAAAIAVFVANKFFLEKGKH